MDVQQLSPWVSVLASVLTILYVGIEEWRRYLRSNPTSDRARRRPPLGHVIARADVFLLVTVTMLFLASLAHYLLSHTLAAFLVGPVWLLTVFVVVVTGVIQTMPGERFDEKLDGFTERAGGGVEVARSREEAEGSSRDDRV